MLKPKLITSKQNFFSKKKRKKKHKNWEVHNSKELQAKEPFWKVNIHVCSFCTIDQSF